MDKKSQKYRPLCRKKRTYFGFHRLWLGVDHVLGVESRTVSEDYRRFYFADIQAIIVRRTAAGRIQNLASGSMGGISLFLAAMLTDGLALFFWISAGLTLSWLLYNWFCGPTCVCHLQTAVQTEKLPSLNRLKAATKAVTLLKPLIEGAQGKLGPLDSVPEAPIPASPRPERAAAGSQAAAGVLRNESGKTHRMLYFLLIGLGLSVILETRLLHVAGVFLETIFILAAGACAVIALVKQHGSDVPKPLRVLTWTALVHILLNLLLGYAAYFFLVFKNPELAQDQWAMICKLSELSASGSALVVFMNLFCAGGALILGLIGLVMQARSGPARHAEATAGAALGASPLPLGRTDGEPDSLSK